jgi:hypothetical protein
MREVGLRGSDADLHVASFRASLATILELPLDELPDLRADDDPGSSWIVSRWLGGLGLGLARVVDPGSFAWAGPWLARVRPPDGRLRFVVMFGVPSGVVWDPGGDGVVENAWIEDGFLVAAADIALGRPATAASPIGTGVVEQVWVASSAGEPPTGIERVQAFAGRGLGGDRHTDGTGTFPSGLPGSALTLIAAEVCESFEPPLRADEHRRNLVTRGIDLNSLVGHEFMVGETRCRGRRLCEPCKVVEGYASRPVLRQLVHRGGLRADIVDDGVVGIGDPIRPISGG